MVLFLVADVRFSVVIVSQVFQRGIMEYFNQLQVQKAITI